MWAKRIQRMIEKNRNTVQGILLRKYPAFIWSDRADNLDEIPTFVFHDVTAESLEPMLQFLSDNGYTTLTADEYTERQSRGERGQEREVLLTFDDGRKSLYTVVYPALKRLGLKAVAYIVPGMTPEDNGSNDSEVWEKSLCNWEEVREMQESGTVDIQSHSMYHHSIPTSGQVVDFVRPDMNLCFLASDLAPVIRAACEVRKSHELAYGTPIYEWGARLGGGRAFREGPSVVLACVQHVNRHGGVDFFQTPDWRSRLRAVMAEARRKDNTGGGFETEVEQREAILKDFTNSKREIEQRLPGKTVRHFAYPWFRGSVLAVELSAEVGYVSNAWGSLLPSFVRGNQVPIPIARLPPLYIWRLPGKGRKSIGEIFRERLEPLLWPVHH